MQRNGEDVVRTIFSVVLACAIFAAGCGNYSQKLFYNTPTAVSEIRSVAVFPFENLSLDPHAATVLTEIFLEQLSASQKFDLLDPAKVTALVAERGIDPSKPLDRSMAVEIAKTLGVQGVLVGSVLEYNYLKEIRDGAVVAQEPAVALQVRLIDAHSGAVVWGLINARTSFDVMRSNKDSIANVAEKLVKKIVEELPRRPTPNSNPVPSTFPVIPVPETDSPQQVGGES